MGIRFFEWLRERAQADVKDVTTMELAAAAQEFQIRQLAFWSCVNLVAAALGRCEFRTYRDGKEIREREYYTWNVSPNRNQNSSAFVHEVAAKLYKENEALLVSEPYGDGVLLARSWSLDDSGYTNVYRHIDVGVKGHEIVSLRESEVLHLKLHARNMDVVIGAMNESYLRLVRAAMNNYLFSAGQHWKVTIARLAQGADDFEQKFAQILENQIKPFFNSESAILPEFEGYKYSQVSGGTEKKAESSEVRSLIEDVFNFTARGFLIPAVLSNGKIEGTADAKTRLLTDVVDPIADQLSEEINRKRYGYEAWRAGSCVRVDTSAIVHFDMFANAANVEKLIGSGAWSVNEVRRAAGDAPINEPWADEHFLTLNMTALKKALETIQKEESSNG